MSISIGSWLSIIDLNQFQLMEISSKEIGEDARTHYVKVTLDNGKKVKLVMPNCWDTDILERLEELQEYIETNF